MPTTELAPYVRELSVVETDAEVTRTLIPEPGVVLGLRFRGWAAELHGSVPRVLPASTVGGLRTTARRMRTSRDGGTVIVKFRETGAAPFFGRSPHVLSGRTTDLREFVDRSAVDALSARLAAVDGDGARIETVQQFLVDRLRRRPIDEIVSAAVQALRERHGSMRVRDLAQRVGLSQDALEKRFRAVIGATPKQLASLLRLRRVVTSSRPGATLSLLALEAGYADQPHFTRAFRAMAGESPTRLLRSDGYC